MAGEWREMPFSQAVHLNPKVPLTRGTSYPYVDMAAVSVGSRSALAGEERQFTGSGSRFAVDDTLMARITPCLENGKIARFAGGFDDVAHGSTEFIVIRGREDVSDTDYAYYLTKWDGVSGYAISQMTGTSGRQRVPLEALEHLEVPVPPLSEQRAIAHVLGTLDDKIELNRRKNETLEAMARALFKSWFVDFEPVRAKAEGRDPGLPSAIADLFPDRLVDSEIGKIPKGWAVASLSNFVSVERGLSYKGSGLVPDGVPMHNLNSIFEGGGYKYAGLKRYDGTFQPRHSAKAGDLLVANTEQGHERRLIGYAALIPSEFQNDSLYSHHLYRLGPLRDTELTAVYICYLLNSSTMHDVVSRYSNGTSINMLPVESLQSPLVVVPPSLLMTTFTNIAQATLDRRERAVYESRTLAALRDTLLPKLISGELRVNDADRFLDQVA